MRSLVPYYLEIGWRRWWIGCFCRPGLAMISYV